MNIHIISTLVWDILKSIPVYCWIQLKQIVPKIKSIEVLRCSQVYINKLFLSPIRMFISVYILSFKREFIFQHGCRSVTLSVFHFRLITIELLTDFTEYSELEVTYKDHQVEILSEWWIIQPVNSVVPWIFFCFVLWFFRKHKMP